MKKRMFLSTILMTLVLLVALTTATFAWYSAGTANATHANTTSELYNAKNDYSISQAGVLEGKFSMIKLVELSDSNGDSYHLEGSTPVKNEDADVQANGSYTLTWKEGTTAGQKSAAAGVYTLTLTPSGYMLLAKDEDAYDESLNKAITFKVEITAEGYFRVDDGEANTFATCEFKYAVRAAHTETTGSTATSDTDTDHVNDKVVASWAKVK